MALAGGSSAPTLAPWPSSSMSISAEPTSTEHTEPVGEKRKEYNLKLLIVEK